MFDECREQVVEKVDEFTVPLLLRALVPPGEAFPVQTTVYVAEEDAGIGSTVRVPRYIAGQKRGLLMEPFVEQVYVGIDRRRPYAEGGTAAAALRRARSVTDVLSNAWLAIAVWDREERRY